MSDAKEKSAVSLKFGEDYTEVRGYLGSLRETDGRGHRFGGECWCIQGYLGHPDRPAELMTIDFSDVALEQAGLGFSGCIPLCSYVNSRVWEAEQVYRFEDNGTVTFLGRPAGCDEMQPKACRLPVPLPERGLELRPMQADEMPVDEEAYWRLCDAFLGGDGFIRILGAPLWMQDPQPVVCTCSSQMTHVLSLGYEPYGGPYTVFPDQPFFLGEAALYFFVCIDCSIVRVLSQSS